MNPLTPPRRSGKLGLSLLAARFLLTTPVEPRPAGVYSYPDAKRWRIADRSTPVDFYDVLVHTSLILWIIFGSGLIISLILIVPRILRAFSALDRISDAVTERMLPILERIDGAVQDFGKISDAALVGVERIDETVVHVTDSVERMLDVTEDRVSEINALVTVAIEEAEDTFTSTAGILRAIGGRSDRKKRRDRRQSDRKKNRKRKDRDRWLRGGDRRRLG